jgi:thioesterase domain-containing protein
MAVADVFDYLAWRGDLDFDTAEANAGDRLILCMLSFVDFEGIVSSVSAENEIPLSLAVHRCMENGRAPADARLRRLAKELAESRRFGSILLSGYQTKLSRGESPVSQWQFAAITFRFSSHFTVVYRGTDDTLVGWKENFNSALMYPIPAQEMAASYLKMVSVHGLPIAVQGHSKGGNLAVYAAAVASVPAEQIRLVYDFDGPGFDSSFFDTDFFV